MDVGVVTVLGVCVMDVGEVMVLTEGFQAFALAPVGDASPFDWAFTNLSLEFFSAGGSLLDVTDVVEDCIQELPDKGLGRLLPMVMFIPMGSDMERLLYDYTP